MRLERVSIRRGKVNALFFDCDPPLFAPLSDDGGVLIERGVFDSASLEVGSILSEDDLWQLCEISQGERARQRALWLLDSRDYTRRGMFLKLKPLYGEAAANFGADYCTDIGLIDDERYAQRRAELMSEQGISDRDAVRRLVAKGVDRKTAETAVESVGSDPTSQLDSLIAKKHSARLSTGDKKQIERVVAALARKGFEFSDIREAVSRFCDADNGIYDD